MSKVLGKDASGRLIVPGAAVSDRPMWPSISYYINTDEAQALLGTPNGCDIAWLLIQHKLKHQLGHKVVD
jgi:hypothetical protein